MSDSGLGYTLLATGGLLIYAGMRGYSILEIVGNTVQGKPINQATQTTPLISAAPNSTTQIAPGARIATGSTAQQNQSIANEQAKAYNWDTGTQWDSLLTLWTKESDWDNHAMNSASGAYGIPQALPYTKMPKAAWPESAGGQSDPTAQIQWGLEYIAGRYGLPQFALAYHNQHNWY